MAEWQWDTRALGLPPNYPFAGPREGTELHSMKTSLNPGCTPHPHTRDSGLVYDLGPALDLTLSLPIWMKDGDRVPDSCPGSL